jgi:hypothetical protein
VKPNVIRPRGQFAIEKPAPRSGVQGCLDFSAAHEAEAEDVALDRKPGRSVGHASSEIARPACD